MDRVSLQAAEGTLWRDLYLTKESMDQLWFTKKLLHQKIYAMLDRIEREVANGNSEDYKELSEENVQKLLADIKEKKEGNAVVVCESPPFVVFVSNDEMTDFKSFKAKLVGERSSMDIRCWQHWTTVRSAFWRHEEIRVASA